MNNLSVKHGNLEFINPFLLASSPISRNAEMILRAFELGWAGAVTKTICLDHESIINVTPRLQSFNSKLGIIGLNNIELISERSLKDWIKDIAIIKNNYPDRILIASIMAGATDKKAWQLLTQEVQNAGADIVELNISCPHGMPERGMGSFCSEVPQISAEIVRNVKEVAKIPVWVKLSPNISDISYLAQVCLEAGAEGIVGINTVKGFSGIDIESLKPKLDVNNKSTYGGFSGKIVKPIALKAVSDIAIHNKCFISAAGGISDWQDAIEFILLGSSTLQICTEVMLKGYSIIDNLILGMKDYLNRHNFSSVQSIIGLSLDKITSFESLNKDIRYVAQISQEKCTRCKRCYVSCRDGGYQAIEILDNNSLQVDQDKCSGCGLCKLVCPNNAISRF